MTRSVKVGDKVRVINPWGTQGQYKKGDVLTVRMVAESGIAVEETYRVLLHDEYELIEPIKVGDTVTLIDKPWEHPLWKKLPRNYKKEYITTKGKTWSVERFYDGADPLSGECAFPAGGSRYIIPLELLEKVEPSLDGKNFSYLCIDELFATKHRHTPEQVDDGINAEWIATGVVDDGVIKGMDKPKKGDLFRVIGNDGHHHYNVGDIVEFVSDLIFESYVTYCPKTGRTQIVRKTDIEPYTKHRFTAEQVSEAQRIIGEIVAGFKTGQRFYILDESDKEFTIRYTAEITDGMHTITAHCSPHDEFNRTIGLMVALCKAVGRKLPDWL